MDFNDEQKAVLASKLNSSVAVSAGAGAGKSTILVAKLVNHILNDGLDPDNILVVTFTQDAANSIKAKIKKAIRSNPSLIHLIPKVDAAHIETTDAFRLFLVTKYANVLGIKEQISIVGDDIFVVEKYNYLNNYLNTKKLDPIIYDFASQYIRTGENDINDFIIAIADDIDIKKYPSKLAYVNYINEHFNNIDYAQELIDKYIDSVIDIDYLENRYQEVLSNYDMLEDNDKARLIVEDKYQYFEVAHTKKDYYKALDFLINSKNTSFSIGKKTEEKDAIKKITKELSEIKILSFDEFLNVDIPNNIRYLSIFLELAYDLAIHMDNFKTVHGAYAFSDIEYLSNFLVTIPEVAQEIKNSFKIIMIDEYQDTSDSQNAFYDKISNHNLFLVGDIKQSIYGFRNANPENFANKLQEIKEDHGELYRMNYNYRSRKEVIDKINEIFNSYMTLTYGGVDYKKGEALKKMDPQPPYDDSQGLFLLNKLTTDEAKEIIKSLNIEIGSETKINSAFAEVLSIAGNILQRLKVSKEKGQPLNYKSFAVLTRVGTNFDIYRQVFGYLGIPINILKEEDITNDEVIIVLISFIKLINHLISHNEDETKLKFYFTSVIRSFIYNLDDQTIYDFIVNNLYLDSDIFKDIYSFAIEHLNSSLYITIVDLLSHFKFIEKLSSVTNAVNAITKINFLLGKIQEMDYVGYSISDLVYYLENSSKLNLKLCVNIGKESDDAVTIQTIHGSKGLEYDIVYVGDMEHKFSSGCNNVRGASNPPYFANKKYGYFIPHLSTTKNATKSSLVNGMSIAFENENAISEETRLLYVALTRAKQICIMPISERTKEKTLESRKYTKCYLDIISLSKINIPFDKYGANLPPLAINQLLTFIPTPISYLQNKNTYDVYYTKKASIEVDNKVNDYLLRLGTHYHLLMQSLDFKTLDTSFIKNPKEKANIDRIIKERVIQDAKNAKVYKEYHYYDEELNEEGIIDLLLIYKDKAVIVDYKLKNVDDNKYKTQLDAYISYVKKAFGLPTEALLLPLLG